MVLRYTRSVKFEDSLRVYRRLEVSPSRDSPQLWSFQPYLGSGLVRGYFVEFMLHSKKCYVFLFFLFDSTEISTGISETASQAFFSSFQICVRKLYIPDSLTGKFATFLLVRNRLYLDRSIGYSFSTTTFPVGLKMVSLPRLWLGCSIGSRCHVVTHAIVTGNGVTAPSTLLFTGVRRTSSITSTKLTLFDSLSIRAREQMTVQICRIICYHTSATVKSRTVFFGLNTSTSMFSLARP